MRCLIITLLFAFACIPEQAYGINQDTALKGSAVAAGELAGLGLTDRERDFLARHKTIRVAFDGYFPPYSYLNEQGEFEGLAVDIMNMLADRTGIKIEVYPDGLWKNLYEAARRKEVDVVATMVERPERRKWFAFTRPYIFKSLVVMTRKNGTVIESPGDISGKTIALVRGYQYVPRILKEFPTVKPYYVDTMLDGLNAVATGKADGAITFLGAGHHLKTKYLLANLQFSAVFDRNNSLESIAVRRDMPELASILDRSLGALEDELKSLQKKWNSDEFILATHHGGPVVRKEIIAAIAGLIVLMIVALGGIYFWNRSLKRQVNIRTAELTREIEEKKKAEAELGDYKSHLEQLVKERTASLEKRTFELEKSQQALSYLVEDVNESRAELEVANKKLRELDQLKSMFIASMSHELRTPLNSIIGFTSITLQGLSGELNAEQRDNLTRAYKAGQHLLDLITDVIDISKIEANRIDIFPEEFSLQDLIEEAIETVGPQAKEKGLSVKKAFAEDMHLYSDRKRLLQSVLNLLSNAVKYTEHGGVVVKVRKVRRSEDEKLNLSTSSREWVEIAVEDTGLGIAGEDMEKLFEPFERLKSHLRIKAGGTGLGLYLTKKIMTELLHGNVTVESSPGEGCRFILQAPMRLKNEKSGKGAG